MTFRTHRCQETSSPGGYDKVHVVGKEERECLLTGANLENVQYTSVAQHQTNADICIPVQLKGNGNMDTLRLSGSN